MNNHEEHFRSIDKDSARAASVLLSADELLKYPDLEKEDQVDMCKALNICIRMESPKAKQKAKRKENAKK